jgi:hypothetical protein
MDNDLISLGWKIIAESKSPATLLSAAASGPLQTSLKTALLALYFFKLSSCPWDSPRFHASPGWFARSSYRQISFEFSDPEDSHSKIRPGI